MSSHRTRTSIWHSCRRMRRRLHLSAYRGRRDSSWERRASPAPTSPPPSKRPSRNSSNNLVGIFTDQSQPVNIKRVLHLEHVGGIGQVQALTRYFGGSVVKEAVEDREFIPDLGKVDNVSPHLRGTVGVLLLFAFLHDETPHFFSVFLFDRVVVEYRLHDKERFLPATLAERIHEFVVDNVHCIPVGARFHHEVGNGFDGKGQSFHFRKGHYFHAEHSVLGRALQIKADCLQVIAFHRGTLFLFGQT